MGVLGGQSGAWHGQPLCPQPAQLLPLPTLREHTQRPENLPVKVRALSCLYQAAFDLHSPPTEPAEQSLGPSL